jgi:hypothetical protein
LPYYVGATYSLREAEMQLSKAALRVTHSEAIAHLPRAPAIWLNDCLARLRQQKLISSLTRAFRRIESLGSWPTRNLTGYFLAFRAIKQQRLP